MRETKIKVFVGVPESISRCMKEVIAMPERCHEKFRQGVCRNKKVLKDETRLPRQVCRA